MKKDEYLKVEGQFKHKNFRILGSHKIKSQKDKNSPKAENFPNEPKLKPKMGEMILPV